LKAQFVPLLLNPGHHVSKLKTLCKHGFEHGSAVKFGILSEKK
jgi:3-dehydroquinate synthetase